MLLGWFVLVPWLSTGQPFHSLAGLRVDLSFILSMPWFLQQQLQFGPELVFTYGPLGVLAGNVVPAAWFAWLIAARLALATVFVLAWLRVIQGTPRAFAVFSFANVYALSFFGWEQYFWVSFPLLAAVLTVRGGAPAALLAALTAAAAAASLVKFNFLLVSVVCFGGMFVSALGDRTSRRWPPLLYAALLLLFWCALGQRPLGIVAWTSASLDLSAGYDEAMAKGFHLPYGPLDVTLFGGAIGLLAGLWLVLQRQVSARRLPSAVLGATLLVIACICNRHAWGGNQLEQAASVLILCSLVLGAFTASGGRRSRLAWPLLALALAALWLVLALNNLFLIVPPSQIATKLADTLGAMCGTAASPASSYRERTLGAIRQQFPGLERVQGTTDALPDNGAVLLAFPQITYTPRPAYLSLNAHTARLTAANAQFFAGDRAPQNVLFEIVPMQECVHHRLPASLDGLALRQILGGYELREAIAPFLWFERRPARAPWKPPVTTSLDVTLGEPVPLPNDAIVWAEFTIRKTRAGAVLQQLYKLPQIELCYNGREPEKPESYQILPRVAGLGFFVHPVLRTTADVAALQHALDTDCAITPSELRGFEIRQQDGPGGLWDRAVHIRLETWSRDGSLRK